MPDELGDALARVGTLLGPTSEACSLIARGPMILDYVPLQPIILEQSLWTARLLGKKRFLTRDALSVRDSLRSQCTSAPHSGDWLNICPSVQIVTKLPSLDFVRLLWEYQ